MSGERPKLPSDSLAVSSAAVVSGGDPDQSPSRRASGILSALAAMAAADPSTTALLTPLPPPTPKSGGSGGTGFDDFHTASNPAAHAPPPPIPETATVNLPSVVVAATPTADTGSTAPAAASTAPATASGAAPVRIAQVYRKPNVHVRTPSHPAVWNPSESDTTKSPTNRTGGDTILAPPPVPPLADTDMAFARRISPRKNRATNTGLVVVLPSSSSASGSGTIEPVVALPTPSGSTRGGAGGLVGMSSPIRAMGRTIDSILDSVHADADADASGEVEDRTPLGGTSAGVVVPTNTQNTTQTTTPASHAGGPTVRPPSRVDLDVDAATRQTETLRAAALASHQAERVRQQRRASSTVASGVLAAAPVAGGAGGAGGGSGSANRARVMLLIDGDAPSLEEQRAMTEAERALHHRMAAQRRFDVAQRRARELAKRETEAQLQLERRELLARVRAQHYQQHSGAVVIGTPARPLPSHTLSELPEVEPQPQSPPQAQAAEPVESPPQHQPEPQPPQQPSPPTTVRRAHAHAESHFHRSSGGATTRPSRTTAQRQPLVNTAAYFERTPKADLVWHTPTAEIDRWHSRAGAARELRRTKAVISTLYRKQAAYRPTTALASAGIVGTIAGVGGSVVAADSEIRSPFDPSALDTLNSLGTNGVYVMRKDGTVDSPNASEAKRADVALLTASTAKAESDEFALIRRAAYLSELEEKEIRHPPKKPVPLQAMIRELLYRRRPAARDQRETVRMPPAREVGMGGLVAKHAPAITLNPIHGDADHPATTNPDGSASTEPSGTRTSSPIRRAASRIRRASLLSHTAIRHKRISREPKPLSGAVLASVRQASGVGGAEVEEHGASHRKILSEVVRADPTVPVFRSLSPATFPQLSPTGKPIVNTPYAPVQASASLFKRPQTSNAGDGMTTGNGVRHHHTSLLHRYEDDDAAGDSGDEVPDGVVPDTASRHLHFIDSDQLPRRPSTAVGTALSGAGGNTHYSNSGSRWFVHPHSQPPASHHGKTQSMSSAYHSPYAQSELSHYHSTASDHLPAGSLPCVDDETKITQTGVDGAVDTPFTPPHVLPTQTPPATNVPHHPQIPLPSGGGGVQPTVLFPSSAPPSVLLATAAALHMVEADGAGGSATPSVGVVSASHSRQVSSGGTVSWPSPVVLTARNIATSKLYGSFSKPTEAAQTARVSASVPKRRKSKAKPAVVFATPRQ